ncbi:DNA gyrase inhibitor [Paenibacillus sp. MY03]|uniref:AraC family transcriptional regulator n=1 Tax=Paenibacillus sp. MY03 TaxID=302980 RepID=UPI000B3C23BA|nr:GyrI-like domain-containing protein [Paenibacillus sp. MY03]OUS77079.1 DNA gyrase inhibitor [Paenibacillus sp. MY03]
MKMRMEILPNYRLAYVRQTGPYGPANTQAMQQIKEWSRAKGLLTESTVLLGIANDNPRTTSPQECRYDACIVLADHNAIDESIGEREFVGGEYAIFTVKHTSEDVQRAWGAIFPALHDRGLRQADKPIIERYVGNMEIHDFCEICVPVER